MEAGTAGEGVIGEGPVGAWYPQALESRTRSPSATYWGDGPCPEGSSSTICAAACRVCAPGPETHSLRVVHSQLGGYESAGSRP
jgi:hypothetical protein